jgi:hypothetical protein
MYTCTIQLRVLVVLLLGEAAETVFRVTVIFVKRLSLVPIG